MNPGSAPTTALVTGWDRLAVIVLGGAGCALSASALMQMAVAIHIRPALCWLFPLVVDGFIAYGIRALLVLRTAPLRARLYVWTLVGTATGVSVWANALHAVRINQTGASAGGLQLGDTVVAYLSTVAPLALAGAVHLYILIARGPDNHADRADRTDRPGHGQAGQRSPGAGQAGAGQPVSTPTGLPGVTGVTGNRLEGVAVAAADRVGQRSPGAGQAGAGQPVSMPTGLPGVPGVTGNGLEGVAVAAADRVGQRSPRPGQAGAGQPVSMPTGLPGVPGVTGNGLEGVAVAAADRVGQRSPRPGQAGAGQPVTTPTGLPGVTGKPPTPVTGSLTGIADPADTARPVTGHHDTRIRGNQAADLGGQPDSGLAVSDRPAATEPVTARPVGHRSVTDRPVTGPPVSDREPRRAGDRRPDLDTEELLEIARSAVRAEDKLTRQIVAQAIRGQRIPLSSDTLTALMAQLREQRDEPVTTSRD